jgi:hypothetical protein
MNTAPLVNAEVQPEAPLAVQTLPPGFRLLTEREVTRMQYPKSGTGLRQGARIARQVYWAWSDPFAASNKCLARIKERLAAKAAA